MQDIKRNLEDKALKNLDMFPAIAIVGARQTGKTTLSKKICPDWEYFDLENTFHYDRISHDPYFFFEQYPSKVIIDEAQLFPELFSILRGVIDAKRHLKGRFILTGSSSPELLENISETLAGRIATIELGTLKANEYYGKPLSPFYDIFKNALSKENFIEGKPPLTAAQMQLLWVKGGYPEPILHSDLLFYNQWMENYYNTYINRDLSRYFPRLDKIAYRRFLLMLGKLSGTIVNKMDLGRAVEVSEKTIRDYITIAEGTFLWRNLPSFDKNVIKSIIKMPKGHIRDTGLLHYLNRISSETQLFENPILGSSFEAFVIEEIEKGLQATMLTNLDLYYYRTRGGAEIDLIIEGPFGILPIEIKYGMGTKIKQLTALSQFVAEHKLPFGMVINQTEQITWLTPNIVQVPVGWL